MGAPFVRHTHAEREMNVMVAMDVSRSMALGTTKHSKREAMTFITGSILFSALSDQINTGFLAFGDKVLLSTQPQRTRAAAWSVLEQAWALKPSVVEDADAAARPAPDAHAEAHEPDLHRLGLRHERRGARPARSWRTWRTSTTSSRSCPRIAPRPSCRAGGGYLHMRDLESGRRVSVGLGRQARGRYADAIRERRESLARAFYRVPMDHVFVPTDRQPGAAGVVALCQEKSVIRRFLPSCRSPGSSSAGARARADRPATAVRARPRPPPPTPTDACGAAVQVRASVDRTAIWVGDRVTYTVDIVCARGVEILLDDLAKEKLRVNGLDVVSSDTTTTVDASERTTYRLRYVLTTYRVDVPSLSIEPLSARYYARRPGQRLQDIAPAGEVQVPGAVIAFRSTLPDQPTYELRDGRARGPAAPDPVARRIRSGSRWWSSRWRRPCSWPSRCCAAARARPAAAPRVRRAWISGRRSSGCARSTSRPRTTGAGPTTRSARPCASTSRRRPACRRRA